MFVENVAVDPECQGSGLGRRLMAFAEDRARRDGLPRLELYTNVKMTETIPFYAGLGFEETERRIEDGFRRVYMEKRMSQV